MNEPPSAPSNNPEPASGGAPIHFSFYTPRTTADFAQTRTVFREYGEAQDVDLSFQSFDAEMAGLPGSYAEPRGQLILALAALPEEVKPGDAGPDDSPTILKLEDGTTAQIAGCCALQPLDTVDYANAAEMKRLYVRPAFRGMGLGRQLAEAILDAARAADYDSVLLDTLDEMETARGLYEDLGFVEVPPYYHNPIAGAHYLRVEL